jgi:hypothetical protein
VDFENVRTASNTQRRKIIVQVVLGASGSDSVVNAIDVCIEATKIAFAFRAAFA